MSFLDANKFPNRPDHPDFWRLSDCVLRLDGASQEATDNAFESALADTCDETSLLYMGAQRVLRMCAAIGIADREQIAAVLAVWCEGFIVGSRFEKKGGRRA